MRPFSFFFSCDPRSRYAPTEVIILYAFRERFSCIRYRYYQEGSIIIPDQLRYRLVFHSVYQRGVFIQVAKPLVIEVWVYFSFLI